jgi:hypothetical protein
VPHKYLQLQPVELQVSPATDINAVQSIAIQTAQEIASKFGVPLPRVEVGNYPTGEYIAGTIHLPYNLSPEMVVRMVAHEMAHHIHSYFGVPCTTPEAEVFASMFEEAWIKMKRHGYNYPVMPCKVCGYKLFLYSNRVVCPKCGSVYTYRYPDPGLGKAIALAILSATGTYVLTEYLMKYPQLRQKPLLAGTLASAAIGFLTGLI